MLLGEFHKLPLIHWDSHRTSSISRSAEDEPTKRKHPVSSCCAEENDLVVIKGQRSDVRKGKQNDKSTSNKPSCNGGTLTTLT